VSWGEEDQDGYNPINKRFVEMHIIKAGRDNTALLASLVRRSNKDVAQLLHLTIANAPKHPSFCTEDWIRTDFDRGQEYFLATEKDEVTGCVAFEQPDEDTAYLNRLSVVPEYRNRGTGASLVQHIINYSKSKSIKNVSIGIIAEHSQLKEWYLKMDFVEGATQKFDHLPFNVLYMRYTL